MSSSLVYITREIPRKGIALLEDEFEVRINEKDRNLTRDELLNEAKDAVGLITMLSDTIDRQVMDKLPNLQSVANYAVGYNNIDVEAANERNIVVSNTPDVLTETTADLAWGLMLATARRIVESDKYTRAGKFSGWSPKFFLGKDVHNSKLGIIGMGRIGKAVARRAKGFQMKVLYNKRNKLNKKEEKKLNVKYRDLYQLLRESDFISINAPLNDSTYHLISRNEFSIMKNSAIIINTGRGAIIDEDALVKALENEEIAGAGLDVFEKEPQVHPGLKKLDNVVLTPHTGSATVKTRDDMAKLAAKGLIAGIKRFKTDNIINPEIIN